MPKFRSAFSSRSRVSYSTVGPSLAQQSAKDECDINAIMRRYERTGLVDHVSTVQGRFGDFSNAMDYQSSLNAVMAAQESFMALPASLRAAFHNDPAALVAFVSDPENYDQAREMGLVPPKVDTPPADNAPEAPQPAEGGESA